MSFILSILLQAQQWKQENNVRENQLSILLKIYTLIFIESHKNLSGEGPLIQSPAQIKAILKVRPAFPVLRVSKVGNYTISVQFASVFEDSHYLKKKS